jgi:hypothetical protein
MSNWVNLHAPQSSAYTQTCSVLIVETEHRYEHSGWRSAPINRR